jgi:hypothetical protein
VSRESLSGDILTSPLTVNVGITQVTSILMLAHPIDEHFEIENHKHCLDAECSKQLVIGGTGGPKYKTKPGINSSPFIRNYDSR